VVSITGECDPGFYCLRGSNTPKPTSASASGGPCTKGHYCPKGTAFPKKCLRGTYNPNTGEAECFPCLQGYYCTEGLETYINTPCPAGHYCPNGTQFSTQYPCPKGYFNNRTHGTNIGDCLPCPGGSYCGIAGLSKPSGKCSPGWFCVRASWSKTPQDYDNFTSGNCLCPSNSTGGECQPGFYCEEGSHEPTPCTGGYYCGTKGLSAVSNKCDPGWYCTSGAKVSQPKDGVTGNICPPGKYCTLGTKLPQLCPQGRYSNNTGNKAESDCIQCTNGSYCQGLGNTKPTGLCDPGFYCPSGQHSSKPFACTKGHYCSRGSPAPIKCPSGTYQDETQKDSCKMCPEGYYCDNTNDLSSFTPYLCPKGYYCPNGTKFSTQYGCPNGTYGNATKLRDPSQCIPCPAGKYCIGMFVISDTHNLVGTCSHCTLLSLVLCFRIFLFTMKRFKIILNKSYFFMLPKAYKIVKIHIVILE